MPVQTECMDRVPLGYSLAGDFIANVEDFIMDVDSIVTIF
ncbi:hypothetical protein DSUL_20221 [Desulfovibrionales bacterium]